MPYDSFKIAFIQSKILPFQVAESENLASKNSHPLAGTQHTGFVWINNSFIIVSYLSLNHFPFVKQVGGA